MGGGRLLRSNKSKSSTGATREQLWSQFRTTAPPCGTIITGRRTVWILTLSDAYHLNVDCRVNHRLGQIQQVSSQTVTQHLQIELLQVHGRAVWSNTQLQMCYQSKTLRLAMREKNVTHQCQNTAVHPDHLQQWSFCTGWGCPDLPREELTVMGIEARVMGKQIHLKSWLYWQVLD